VNLPFQHPTEDQQPVKQPHLTKADLLDAKHRSSTLHTLDELHQPLPVSTLKKLLKQLDLA
jgi:hypothetical protein